MFHGGFRGRFLWMCRWHLVQYYQLLQQPWWPGTMSCFYASDVSFGTKKVVGSSGWKLSRLWVFPWRLREPCRGSYGQMVQKSPKILRVCKLIHFDQLKMNQNRVRSPQTLCFHVVQVIPPMTHLKSPKLADCTLPETSSSPLKLVIN